MADAERAKWSTDAYGFVTGVRYHDGHLAELAFDHENARVAVAVVGGGTTCFHFRGGIAFGSLGVVSRAIINGVRAVRLERSSEVSAELRHALDVLYGGMATGDAAAADRLLQGKAGSVLAYFDCSYGGPFSILADDMWLTRTGY